MRIYGRNASTATQPPCSSWETRLPAGSRSLNLSMTRAEANRPTEHPDALDHLFRGRAVAAESKSRERYAKAISSFERALDIDPRLVEAQGRLAIALLGRVFDTMTD